MGLNPRTGGVRVRERGRQVRSTELDQLLVNVDEHDLGPRTYRSRQGISITHRIRKMSCSKPTAYVGVFVLEYFPHSGPFRASSNQHSFDSRRQRERRVNQCLMVVKPFECLSTNRSHVHTQTPHGKCHCGSKPKTKLRMMQKTCKQ